MLYLETVIAYLSHIVFEYGSYGLVCSRLLISLNLFNDDRISELRMRTRTRAYVVSMKLDDSRMRMMIRHAVLC